LLAAVATFGSEQYVWKLAGVNGYADPHRPPAAQVIQGSLAGFVRAAESLGYGSAGQDRLDQIGRSRRFRQGQFRV
jgi:hypothetical protein